MQSQSHDPWVRCWLSIAKESRVTCFRGKQAINRHHRHHRVLGQKVCELAAHLEQPVLEFFVVMCSTFCLAAWKISALLSTSFGWYFIIMHS
jgi:hypothetical protein